VFVRNYVRNFYVKNFHVEILKRDLYGDFFNNDQRRNKNIQGTQNNLMRTTVIQDIKHEPTVTYISLAPG